MQQIWPEQGCNGTDRKKSPYNPQQHQSKTINRLRPGLSGHIFVNGLNRGGFMRIGIPAETRAGETRVAATPETVKKRLAAGHQLMVRQGAGSGASIPDAEFQAAGATLIGEAELYAQAEIVLKVEAPTEGELAR